MYKEILLPVDLEETVLSERAVIVAQDIADCDNATITVLTVIPDFGMPMVANFFPKDAMHKAQIEVQNELKRFIESRFREPDTIRHDVAHGTPHRLIVQHAREHKADLIVLPARAQDLGKMLLGSCSTHVVERAPCSVLIVRP